MNRPRQTSRRSAFSGLVALLLTGCSPQPLTLRDAGPGSSLDGPLDAGPRLSLLVDQPFGEEGEVPTHLLAAQPGDLLALTQGAVYQLSSDGRVKRRTPLPAPSGGGQALVSGAAFDGLGLGLGLTWGHDTQVPAGAYMALTDGHGVFQPSSMVKLGPSSARPLSVWDGTQHQVLYPQFSSAPSSVTMDVKLARFTRASSPVMTTLLTGLPSSTTLGGLVSLGKGALGFCTVENQTRVVLRRTSGQTVLPPILVHAGPRPVRESCQLAWSGRAFLVGFTLAALPPSQTDAGQGAPDRGLGSITHDVPVVQAIDPMGQLVGSPIRLSTRSGTLVAQDLLWDGLRFGVLVLAASDRGGRLVLTLVEETGTLITRDLELPLVYEPGKLMAARLVVTAEAWNLLYSRMLPWDEGVLHLCQLRLTPG